MQGKDEKRSLDKKFNVYDVINKTYSESSEYDLNDTLIYLSRIITQTKIKNKELVKANFNKFVECRIVLEEILEDIKVKNLDKDFSNDIFINIKQLKNKFKPIKNKEDFNKERKQMIVNKYKSLFSIKSLLTKNIENAERFVDIFQKARKQYLELKESKYIQNIWESTKQVQTHFKEKLYLQIIDPKKTYMEVLYLFDLYFKMAENKTDRKIMNTLLVNFKEKCLNMTFKNKSLYLKEVNFYFLKTIIHFDKELQKEIVITLFDKIKQVFIESDFSFVKIWFQKYKCLLPEDIDLEVKSVYTVNYQHLKKKIINKFLDSRNLFSSYNRLLSIIDNNEKSLLNDKVLVYIENESKKLKFEKSNDIKNYFAELKKFDKYLLNYSDDFQILKKNILRDALHRKTKDLCRFLTNSTNVHKKLIEIVRIINKLPDYYKIILQGVVQDLQKDKIILFFAACIIESTTPELNASDKAEVNKLSAQFGFLIKNKSFDV